MNSRFFWSEKRCQVAFCCLKSELKTGEDQHFSFEDWWSVATKDHLNMNFWLLLTTCVGASSCSLSALGDTLMLFLQCSEWILLWDWGTAKMETTLHRVALRSVRLLRCYPGQVLHLHLKFIIYCIRSLSRWLPNTRAGTRNMVGTTNAWSRAGWVKSSPAWGGTKCPRFLSWHEISLGASPVATCTDARAETWTWSPPGAESWRVWVAHTWQTMLDATVKAAVFSLLYHPHTQAMNILKTQFTNPV